MSLGRGRAAGLALSVAGVMLLFGWYARDIGAGRFGLAALVQHGERFDGQEVVISLGRLTWADGVGFIVEKSGERFAADGVPVGSIGDEITVIGRWDQGARRIREAVSVEKPGRPAKRRLGVLGLLVVGLGCVVGVRVSPAGWAPRG